MVAHYKKFKNGLFLPGLKRLIAKPTDKRIPLRIVDEMKTKAEFTKYTIMHPDVEPVTTAILNQTQAETWMIIRVTSKGHGNKIVENIMKSQDLRQHFHDLYVDWTMSDITKLSESQINHMNISETPKEVIEGYYKMYVHGIVNRYNCYILRSQEYQKIFI